MKIMMLVCAILIFVLLWEDKEVVPIKEDTTGRDYIEAVQSLSDTITEVMSAESRRCPK